MEDTKNITISGPIGVGTTTLGRLLAKKLGWRFMEGGEIFKDMHKSLGIVEEEVLSRPDEMDVEFDKKMKILLSEEEHQVIESHLAGYNGQNIPSAFKIRLVCEEDSKDRQDMRIARVAKRDGMSFDEAKKKVLEREQGNIAKYERVYHINPYTNAALYDLTINTFANNEEKVLQIALDALRE